MPNQIRPLLLAVVALVVGAPMVANAQGATQMPGTFGPKAGYGAVGAPGAGIYDAPAAQPGLAPMGQPQQASQLGAPQMPGQRLQAQPFLSQPVPGQQLQGQ